MSQDNENMNSINRLYEEGLIILNREAQNIYSNYNDRLKPTIKDAQIEFNKDLNYNPTEYLWLSKDDLKAYLTLLEEVELKNQDQPTISGVSLYLGAYDKNKSVVNDEPRPFKRIGNYSGRMTLFFTPTYLKDNKQIPFCVKRDPNSVDPYVGIFEALNFNSASDIENQTKEVYTSLTLNELNAVPPPPQY